MKENDLPNYYSVIPAKVRYCPDLSFFEIVLYSEISALTNALGYCYASNNYFAKLFRKDVMTISRAIKNLSDFGFISLEITKEEGNKRKIYLAPIVIGVNTPIDVGVYTPIDVGVYTPIDVGVYNNNTSVNTKLKQSARASEEKNIGIYELFKKVYKYAKG